MEYRFRNHYTVSPDDVQADDCFALKVVAVAGYGHDWAAYSGPTDWTDQEVVACGDKLSREQGEPLFYIMRASGRHYRD